MLQGQQRSLRRQSSMACSGLAWIGMKARIIKVNASIFTESMHINSLKWIRHINATALLKNWNKDVKTPSHRVSLRNTTEDAEIIPPPPMGTDFKSVPRKGDLQYDSRYLPELP